MIYNVSIEETLRKTVEIEAESEEEAFDKAQQQWENEDIVLTSDDFCDVIILV